MAAQLSHVERQAGYHQAGTTALRAPGLVEHRQVDFHDIKCALGAAPVVFPPGVPR